MKWVLIMMAFLNGYTSVSGQEEELGRMQIEQEAERSEEQLEEDSYWQHLEQLKKNPLNINKCAADDLLSLQMLSEIQVHALLSYRRLLGDLISIYEMQAIPGWDLTTIRKLLPFIAIKNTDQIDEVLKKRLYAGDNALLFRTSRAFSSHSTRNLGGQESIQFRYKYQYKNLLQWGITGDKDAGEPFLKDGFDFYSFHLFARNIGSIKSIAIGDYTVNMGQGLINWQSMAFKKGPAVLSIKRQGPSVNPYRSAGEFNFHRGMALNWQRRKWEGLFFVSFRRLDGNVVFDSSVNEVSFISSIVTSGYHRTNAELADRKKLNMIAAGGNLRRQFASGRIGVNSIVYKFSSAIRKESIPYNLYSWQGDRIANVSIDYSYTIRNVHLAGELATDNKGNKAIVNGILASLDAKIDMVVLFRHISPAYASLFSNAFTENTFPVNERGWYAAVSLRPVHGWQIDAYADMYKFPWLKFRIDAPGTGHDFFIGLTHAPIKNAAIITRFKAESRPLNNATTGGTVQVIKKSWRIEVNYAPVKTLELSSRAELLWYENPKGGETGFLGFGEVAYRPRKLAIVSQFRLLYFETANYDSRLYSFENDLLYNYSVPVLYGKGWRWYLNTRINIKKIVHLKVNKNFTTNIKIAQTIVPDSGTTESPMNEANGLSTLELKVQFLLGW